MAGAIRLTTRTLATGFVFLEGPRWHEDALWVSDMWDHRVFRVTPAGVRTEVCEVPGRPSGLGFLADGTLLVVSMSDRKILHLTARGLSVHADLAAVAGGDLNDMLTEPQGSSYVGNFGYDLLGGAEKKLTDLHRVDAGGNVSVAASGLDFPNGMAITDEGRTLIVAETWAHRLTAFDRSPSGALSNRRVFAELGEREPDGLQGDTEGRVWTACFHAGEFLRVGPGGVVDAVVEVPGRRAVACALDPARRLLYCVTFTGDLADITKRQRTSSIEVAEIPR